ncbi:MAG: hypothetical protein P8M78_06180 [Myxococcota bacterium]|nr:hypothetical protein [Myxococcota bacterium]
MYRKFVNARSPMRLLENGLHGGLGLGNVGALIAGHGVGKTPFLVGVGMDELLRGGTVLHVAIDQTVGHVKDFYDTVFAALATNTHLDDPQRTQGEIDHRRRIRTYPARTFNVDRLSEAIQLETETGARPTLILMDGLEAAGVDPEALKAIRELSIGLAAETWFTIEAEGERIEGLPAPWAALWEHLHVILALEPEGEVVHFRALKDHDNPDLQELRVGLDPRTLLLIRS